MELAAERLDSPLLVASSVTVTVSDRTILAETDVEVGPGQIVAVLGSSGSGKTTLLACLGGLRSPSAGTVSVLGEELTSMTARRRARFRLHKLGFVYQHADLLPELTTVQNVMLPALLAGVDAELAEERARRLIADLGIVTAADTAVVSGGEAQRLALARALITDPMVLLADEPTGSLDPATRDQVLDLMCSQVRSRGIGAVIVTHDPVVASAADRTVTLQHDPVAT